MSDPENDPLRSLLDSFALGPAWARAASEPTRTQPERDRPQRRDDRSPQRGGRDGGERRPFQRRDERRDFPPRQEEILPADGVRVTIAPDPKAVHLIVKEIHQVARVYPLFDVAKILLAEKARCRVIFEAPEPHAALLCGKLDESVFLTRSEAVRHLWSDELREQFIEEETIEVDPPSGNFQAIARCGISGEWLGPVNFHSYQTNLRRLHRERFAHLPFDVYAAKVRTERGDEAVNAWLETTKKKTRWRLKLGDEEPWLDDRAELDRVMMARCLDKAFEEKRSVEVSGAIPAKNLSPALLASLRLAGGHARKHPAILIPAVCRSVEAEHLPVFKRSGKLHTGPARPHPLPPNAVLAERPEKIVAWIRANKPAKLEGLWKSVLPEGGTAPPSEFAADLFWLLQQGHILLFTDDTLVVQEVREATTPAEGTGEGKKKRKKRKKSKATAEGTEATATDAEESSEGDESDDPDDSDETSEAEDQVEATDEPFTSAEPLPPAGSSSSESEPPTDQPPLPES